MVGLLSNSGTLAQSVRYVPYGENASVSGSLASSPTNDPFLFQGYQLAGGNSGLGNVANGLYHFGARYYDPTIRSLDPAGPTQSNWRSRSNRPVRLCCE
jgi:hypothetical protein